MTVSKVSKKSDTYSMKFIRDLREKQGLSRDELAIRSGVQSGTLRVIERGTVRVDLEILCRLRRALGLSWDALGRLIEREIEADKRSGE